MRLKRVRRTLFFTNNICQKQKLNMKKVLLPIMAVAMVLFVACKGEHKSASQIFQEGLTAQDSTTMLQKCDSCMQFLSEGRIDDALSMLVEYDDSLQQVSPLSDETRASYKRKFTLFPVLKYDLQYISFNTEGLNDAKYEVQFGPDEAGAPKTAYMFNPVKVDGQWYLCVKNANQAVDIMNR